MTLNRRLTLLDAPSNLGLKPPAAGVAPGVYKLAGALRDQRLLQRLSAADAGVVTAPRYRPAPDEEGQTRNQDAIATYSVRLADRINSVIDGGGFPIVLGGDCSILLGAALALRRRARYGLAYIDAHDDFRHPDNSTGISAAAGEDLALVTGRGPINLTNIEGLGPYFDDNDVIALGIRDDEGWSADMGHAGIAFLEASRCVGQGADAAATALRHLARPELSGYWLHVDVDVLDPSLMPAGDSPEPNGLDWNDLSDLLVPLLRHEAAIGMQITIFDPDLDPDGALAVTLASFLVDTLTQAGRHTRATDNIN